MACLIMACAGVAHAGPKMHVNMSTKSYFVGEEFTYELLISGAEKVEISEPEESDELRIKFVERVKMDQSTPASISLRYRMMPMKPGMISLPVFSVEADGHDLMTDEEVFIEADLPGGYPGLTFTRSIPNKDFYVGEPFRADYVWKSPLPLGGYRAIQLNLPLFYESQFNVRSLHHWIAGDDKAAIGLPVSNTRLIARYGQLDEGDEFFNTVSFSKIVIPLKAGEHLIRSATMLTSYIAPTEAQQRQRGWKTNYPSYFNNNFFEEIDGQSFEKYYVGSQKQTLHVLPLPDAGKPHDFTGEVGKRNITVTASPTIVAAGDPITLTIEVSGFAFPEVIEMPALDKQLAFFRQFAIPAKHSRGKIEGEKKTFIRTLRPRAQDVAAIPSVRLPYFDPITKSYGVAESAPIPITVKAAEVATAFDAEVSGSEPLRNQLESNPEGIRANFKVLESGGAKDLSLSKSQWFLLCFVLPPLGFLLFWQLSAQQRLMQSDPVRARANGAMKKFQKSFLQLSKSNLRSDPEETLKRLDDMVRSYFAEKLNLVSHAHTYEELKVILEQRIERNDRGGGAELEPLKIIYGRCEQGCYRSHFPNASELTELVSSAKQIITTLNSSL